MTDESVFAAAVAIPSPAERAAYLDRACAGNPDLRREVEALLAAHADSNPLDRPPNLDRTAAHAPGEPGASATGEPSSLAVGDRVGPYKLLEKIGEGGMGEVWVADQLEPIKRRVALKLIKPGMDSRGVLARFEAERQALAVMDHPNIARVLDAGTTPDGRPFFVMELVKGVPITEFCDARRLTPKQRLELFVPVCQAIQHAHMKGIIHRDIKPSNVLVALHDETPVPKVIDFGVAKAIGQQLTEKTLYTGFGALVGTPAYMAPEQATFNQLDVDTRADVYALGVLLYELLAGSPPVEPQRLKKAALDEVLRIVREEEPPRPSQRLSTSEARASIAATRQTEPAKLSKLLRGEIDWIVMKALEKDRARRYDTANALAKDLQRYLTGDAVEACPPTLGYRLRKFYRRNRAAVQVGAAFVGMVSGAAVMGATLAVQARRAEGDAVAARKGEAEQREETARQRDAAIEAGQEATRKGAEAHAALGKLKQAQNEQQANQYVWDMQLLPLAYEANNIAEVNRLLDRHIPQPGQPDHRGFEWFYWDRQLHTDRCTDRLPDVTESRRFVEWVASPDGSRVARFTTPVGGNGDPEEPPTLIVWDIATRTVLLKHRMPIEKPVNQSYTSLSPKAPLFSPDGKRVVVEWGFLTPGTQPGGRHLRQVVDVASRKVLLNLEGVQGGLGAVSRGANDVAFSSDGRRLAVIPRTGTPRQGGFPVTLAEVRVWDLESGMEVCRPLDATALAESPFSPDGTLLVTQNRQPQGTRVSVWDLASGKEKAGWDVPNMDLSSLALSPDGTRVAGATSNPIRAGRPKADNPPGEPQVKIWDPTGKELCSFFPPRPYPRTSTMRVFFSPEGARIAVVDRPSGTAPTENKVGDLTLWDAATGRPLPSPAGLEIHTWAVGATSGVGATFSPDGKQIVNVLGNVLRTWDVETGQPVLTLRGHLNPIAARGFTADGKRLWSVEFDGLLKEWAAQPAHVEIRFVAPVVRSGLGNNPTSASDFAVSPNGSHVAAIIELRTDLKVTAPGVVAVRVWDNSGKAVQILQPPPRETNPQFHPAYGLALSRDGRRAVLTRYETGLLTTKKLETKPDLTVWDVESKAVLLHQQLEPGHAPLVAISPDGMTVAVASGKDTGARARIRLFDIDGKRERVPLTAGEAIGVSSLTFSPDGRRLAGLCTSFDAAAGKTSARIGVWDVERSTQLCAVELFEGRPVGAGITTAVRIAWAPDSSRLVFSPDTGRNAELAVYDIPTAKKVLTLDEPVTVGVGTSGLQYVVYSPDGKRIAALQLPRAVGGQPALKLWDAATGKELLSHRPKLFGETLGGKSLTFTGDGHRLQFTELVAERQPPVGGGGESAVRSLLLTTWDATPVSGRESKKE